MASVFKKGRDKNRKRSCWYFSYNDENGSRRTRKGFTDKRATEELALECERNARRIKEGLVDPVEQKRKDARDLKLKDLLVEFEESLKNSSPKYVSLTLSRVRTVVDGCGWTVLSEVNNEAASRFLDKLKSENDLGNRTFNDYASMLQRFGSYLLKRKLVAANPLLGTTRLNAAVDVRHRRRALRSEEIAKLVQSARTSSESVEAIEGETRARIYTLAFLTGLRRKELASLTPESFELKAKQPTLTVEAACSKHRKRDILPLHPDLVDLLRVWLPEYSEGEPLFPGLARKKCYKMVKHDLERVGIPYETKDGIADFHAAGRHSYITELLRSDVSLVDARALARHSDIKMTIQYTHIGMDDQARAVTKLPWSGNAAEQNGQRPGSATEHINGQSESSDDKESAQEDSRKNVSKPHKTRLNGNICQRQTTAGKTNEKVGATRFERATSCSQSRRSSQAELRPVVFL